MVVRWLHRQLATAAVFPLRSSSLVMLPLSVATMATALWLPLRAPASKQKQGSAVARGLPMRLLLLPMLAPGNLRPAPIRPRVAPLLKSKWCYRLRRVGMGLPQPTGHYLRMSSGREPGTHTQI